jgi:hypothetical protein
MTASRNRRCDFSRAAARAASEMRAMSPRLVPHARVLAGSLLLLSLAAPGAVEERRPKLEVLGSVEVPKEANGQPIAELSGLAWDRDENLLYAVSDQGLVHHFVLRLDGARIAELKPVFSGRLSAPGGGSRGLVNAEGLDVLNGANGKPSDAELLVALEDGPTIARFTPQGAYVGLVNLPGVLADSGSYQGKNARLESVTAHPRHGILTAPESPLRMRSDDDHTIFATDGREWSFRTFQPKRSSLKAMEALPDGSLLVLERTRDEKGGAPHARLRHVDLLKCSERGSCPVTDAVSPPGDVLPGNYEGMTRISDDLYLVVSDHAKRDPVSARLVLFRLTAGP